MADRWCFQVAIETRRSRDVIVSCNTVPDHRLLMMEGGERESASDFANLGRYIGSGWVSPFRVQRLNLTRYYNKHND